MPYPEEAALLEACPAALAVLEGPEPRHAAVNAAYRALAGRGADPTGRTLAEVWPEGGAPLAEAAARAAAAGAAEPPAEVLVELGQGRGPSWRRCTLAALLAGPGRQPRWLLTAVDATAEVRALQAARELEATLELERRRGAFSLELTEALSSARSRRDVARTIFEKGLLVLGASAGGLRLRLPEEPDVLEIVEQFGYPEPLVEAWRRLPLTTPAPSSEAVRLGAPVWIASRQEALARFPGWASAVLAGRDQAWASLPLVIGGRIQGTLSLTWSEPQAFEERLQRLLVSVATRCAQALERAEALDAAEQRAAELRALLDAVPVPIFVASDPAGTRIVGNRAGQALLRLPEGANASLRTAASERPPYLPVRGDVPLRLDEMPMQQAIRGREVEGMEYDLLLAGGERRHVVASARPTVDGRGAIRGAVGAFVDVTARVRAERALRESESALRAILDAASESIWLFTVDGVALAANQTAMARWGGPPEEVIGRNLLARLPAALAASRMERFREVVRTGRPVVFEDCRAGISFEHTACPVLDADGRVDRIAVFSRDVTERRRAAEALLEADRRKDEFLALLSHELRNPLAPIRNSLFVLEHADATGERAARARGVIRRQADHLSRLVDDMLDITRIAHGRIELRRERSDLGDAVARTAEDYRAVVEARGATLQVELPRERLWADLDPVRIAQVVGNLLQNAAKFSRHGDRILLALRRLEGGGAAEASVADTGAGIDQAVLPGIFEPFVQGARTLARSEGGLGLGLALVKGLAELHGGSVRAESEGVGRGATFTVRLPLAAAPAAPAAAPPDPGGQVARRRVLVVDDNRDGADTLAEVVALLGHDVLVAYDGPSAIALARDGRPDVVLCDIGLPGVSGYEVARQLRAQPDPPELIALTGYALPEDVERARQAGFARHLGKPVDLAIIEQVLAAR